MNYREFFSTLKTIRNVYLLSGAESYYIDRALNDILNRLFDDELERQNSLTKLDCTKKIEITEIIDAIQSTSLFAEKNVLIVKDTDLFKVKTDNSDDIEEENLKSETKSNLNSKSKSKSKTKKFSPQDRLIKILLNMSETNYVIFTTKESVDKRKKIYKTVEKVGVILESIPLRSWQIDNWLNFTLRSLKKNMDNDAKNYFDERINMLPEISLYFLENELKKVAIYTKSSTITKKDLQSTFTESPELSAFTLIDAVSEKNFNKAKYLLESQINERKEIALIALLVRHVRLLLRIKFFMRQGKRIKDFSNVLGLNPFIAEKMSKTSKNFSDETLEEVFLMLADADYFFKTGKCGSEMLEKIIFKLIKG